MVDESPVISVDSYILSFFTSLYIITFNNFMMTVKPSEARLLHSSKYPRPTYLVAYPDRHEIKQLKLCPRLGLFVFFEN